jgi:hypothetical protein
VRGSRGFDVLFWCWFVRVYNLPCGILYDNTKLAVAEIVKGGKRLRSKMFAELQSHYLLEDRFGRPGKGNDKGKVEGLVGFVRRNFETPLPVAESLDAFNARLRDACTKRGQAILRGHTVSIAERMQADLASFMKLLPAGYPMTPVTLAPRGFHPCRSWGPYKNNDYSVPARYSHQEVLARAMSTRCPRPGVTGSTPARPPRR